MKRRILQILVVLAIMPAVWWPWPVRAVSGAGAPFNIMETTIDDIHKAFKDGTLTAHQLVQMYLDRIDAYDKNGPKINSVITINPKALEEADKLDAEFKKTGKFVGPLHGIPVLVKDQVDVGGLPTTLGSLVMKDYVPPLDAGGVARAKKAGAIMLAKMTLGEMGGGDTYGSLFGVTRNPYDLERTAGGSSGGPGAAVAANFGTVAIGEEGFASARRPSTWNSIVGMRPTPGLVTRSGMWAGWPSPVGQLAPMARTVTDMVKLLDAMAGYDPEDPITSLGVGHVPDTYTKFLDKDGLKGARIGILRQTMGDGSEPDSEDFKKVAALFDKAVGQLKAAGATTIEITIPNLNSALAKRSSNPEDDSASVYFARNPNSPFKTENDMRYHPEYNKIFSRQRVNARPSAAVGANPDRGTPQSRYYEYVVARDQLYIDIMKIMADNKLDAIVHKSIEHTATLIKDGINPPFVNQKGAPHLNTYLIYAASIAVPAGFTEEGLPVGITFFGPPYSEPTMIKLAYAYEQVTHHRIPPKTTPALGKGTTSN
jgi:amidase